MNLVESGDAVWWREGESIGHGFVTSVDGDYIGISDVRIQRPGKRGRDDSFDRCLLRRYVMPLHLKSELLKGVCE